MFAIGVTVVTSFGGNVRNSNMMKKANQYSEVFRANSDFVILEHYINKMVNTAKDLVPKRTGRLQSAIKMRKTDTGFMFYVDSGVADYGIYVEKGTRFMKAREYFVPAIMQHRDPMRRAWLNYLRGNAVSGKS